MNFSWFMSSAVEDDFLNAEQTVDVLRILQESVTNAIKHGKPRQIDISVERDGTRVIISVVNDGGKQFQASQSGHGIRNMMWRASKLQHGELAIKPIADGTVVILSFDIGNTPQESVNSNMNNAYL